MLSFITVSFSGIVKSSDLKLSLVVVRNLSQTRIVDRCFNLFLTTIEAPCKLRFWGFVDLCVPEYVIPVLELPTNLTSTLSFSMWTGAMYADGSLDKTVLYKVERPESSFTLGT
jgi:hypothetical protein